MTAVASTTPHALTGNNMVDSITTGYYWQLDASRILRWSIANGFNGESWNNPQAVYSSVSQALAMVSYYANIKFQFNGYYDTPEAAAPYSELTYSLSGESLLFPSSAYWARAFFPDSDWGYFAGDFFLNINSQANYLPNYDIGSAGFALILHETGHALGLKHTHDSGGTGHPTFSSLGVTQLDWDWFSVMSYDDYYSWNLLSWEPATFMALDALGLMAIYGKNMSTNSGNDFVQLEAFGGYATRWDASGTDTLSVSSSSEGWIIILKLAHNDYVGVDMGMALPTSDVVIPQPKNLLWLLGTYENITGSAYPDLLTGNDVSNSIYAGSGDDFLAGLGGNDTLDGGSGFDIASFSGYRANNVITKSGSSFTVRATTGTDGTDTVTNIEYLQFADQPIIIAPRNSFDEYAALLYQGALGRTPDPTGLAGWTQLANGLSSATRAMGVYGLSDASGNFNGNMSIASGFTHSAEFITKYGSLTNTQFVTRLYANVLDRSPDSAGLAGWQSLLTGGATREHVLVGFALSQEAITNATVGYVGIHGQHDAWLMLS